ncbi:peptidase C15, pyroglutamyl peptidase I-like protein [Gymnopus androsaceus JB14]|uniref:Peptidase C15, pyroglutamyl peptidase I-like protein n=1 Tax=Gymnopus androsaceus JB14 TaxID=1447944 RepID=A0A6A4HKN2_9AGAR|nr:peptidase C15, pyroglutamyl peptidase I-like protein [Gymnopus androsaceus JB14]
MHASTIGGDEDSVFNVLLTGFGPFKNHRPWNPSWLAVKPLHNVVMTLDEDSIVIDGQVVMRAPTTTLKHRLVKISALEVPVEYLTVLDWVPNLHLRPPKGYDFIFHVGVAGKGPLRLEKLGHKTGYFKKDEGGKMAPIIESPPFDFGRREKMDFSVGEQPIEEIRELESAGDTYGANRGFGLGYEKFPDELHTDIDISRLVNELRNSGRGLEETYSSTDAGHYLCDFIYYCSLAESKRNGKPYEKDRNTPVLFMHCPPVGEPLTTEEVTEAIRRTICWVCTELAENHDLASST